jgi:uncharacterized alkaline shock family protein YloU
MKILSNLVVFVCSLTFALAGGILIALALNLFSVQDFFELLQQTLTIQNLQWLIAGMGVFLIVVSLFIAQLTLGKMQREKTIAFNNPHGQVTVSLSALEDFIRRLSSGMTEIKDLRSNVIASKKGIEINARVSLWADSNIPQITENIQEIIKNRIQEMLGIEEAIVVKIHVGKILKKETKRLNKREKEETEEKIVPFRGNIEYGKG